MPKRTAAKKLSKKTRATKKAARKSAARQIGKVSRRRYGFSIRRLAAKLRRVMAMLAG